MIYERHIHRRNARKDGDLFFLEYLENFVYFELWKKEDLLCRMDWRVHGVGQTVDVEEWNYRQHPFIFRSQPAPNRRYHCIRYQIEMRKHCTLWRAGRTARILKCSDILLWIGLRSAARTTGPRRICQELLKVYCVWSRYGLDLLDRARKHPLVRRKKIRDRGYENVLHFRQVPATFFKLGKEVVRLDEIV